VFTALLGALMFGGKLNTRKYAGLVVASIAIILFAVS
jgi:multidrug transporter EmrE-like cation transporter